MDIRSIISQRLKRLSPGISDSLEFTGTGGGSINDCLKISTHDKSWFCKVNSASKFPHLFLKEKKGLELISSQEIILTPAIIDHFEESGYQFLLMDFIQPGKRSADFWKLFGEQIARLHQVHGDHFGLDHDNYMGSVEQLNDASGNWIEFFIQKRLKPLVKKCIEKNLITAKNEKDFERVYSRMKEIFEKTDKPSLLHGDLWNGNYLSNKNCFPVLIDPAVYYGHRSVDLAMTQLFGGFDPLFYEAYHHHYPLPTNYREQWDLCNLYPLLIHVYLFGRSYLSQVETITAKFQ
jgi:protein-ribulosamine 3-kinase